MMSFFRSAMVKKPSSSIAPISPVFSQPSSVKTSRVARSSR
jgi:hypothetical protein